MIIIFYNRLQVSHNQEYIVVFIKKMREAAFNLYKKLIINNNIISIKYIMMIKSEKKLVLL